jgi:hypothetical protein
MDLRKPRPGLTLAKALRMRNPHRFREALVDLAIPYNTGHVPLSARPALVRMITVLNTLHTDVRVSGIWHFLVASDAPVDVPTAQEWCRRIGAARAAAYLADAIALFPKGQLPKDQARREAWVRRMDHSSPDPLAKLDRTYAGSVEEMVDHLRAYVCEHAEEFERAFAAPIPAIPLDEQTELKNALVELQKVGDKITAKRQERVQKAEQRRNTLGITEVFRNAEGDPRMVRFVDEIAVMTPEQWVIVSDRWLAHLRAIKRAVEEVAAPSFDVRAGHLYPSEETQRRKAAHERAIVRSKQVLAVFRGPYKAVGSEEVELRDVAKWSVAQALIILNALDEIMVDKKGERAVRTILSVFEGFITMPF